jgi:hypothetical protein
MTFLRGSGFASGRALLARDAIPAASTNEIGYLGRFSSAFL